jgi:hypothetical protein
MSTEKDFKQSMAVRAMLSVVCILTFTSVSDSLVFECNTLFVLSITQRDELE